jgi:hypothetical protein
MFVGANGISALPVVFLLLITAASVGAIATCLRERRRLRESFKMKDSSFWTEYSSGWIRAIGWAFLALTGWLILLAEMMSGPGSR